jgi:gamma-glutamylputrescine oxidase
MQVSIWEKESFYAPQDIIIVGSGFVGLWSAYYLKKKDPDLRVTIIERGLIPTGASSRNAGFACFGSLSELVHDAQTMGTENMLELVEKRFKGLERIQKVFGKKEIGFSLCGGYELYENSGGIISEELENNVAYINSLLKPVTGSKRTYNRVDEKISTFGFGNTRHLVENTWEGYLHSGKLLQNLLRLVQSMGVQVFTGMEVSSFEKVNDHMEVHVPAIGKLSATQVLLCTNAFTKNIYPSVDIIPARGQVLLTTPIEDLDWEGTFHADEGYYYFRNLGKRVLLGGARNKAFQEEETTEMVTTGFIQGELENYLAEVILPGYKGKYQVEYRWAGIMAMGSEKAPIVKELEPGVFCAVRMSGMGVALAPVVGKEVAHLMNRQ